MEFTRLKFIGIIFCILFIADIHAQTSYVVIVNKSNPTLSLSKKEISNLFLKKANWKDNSLPMPIDLLANSDLRKQFSKEIHGKSVAAIRSYWQQAAFSGTATAPPEKKDDLEVIRFIKNNPSSIGYISRASITNEIKILQITP